MALVHATLTAGIRTFGIGNEPKLFPSILSSKHRHVCQRGDVLAIIGR